MAPETPSSHSVLERAALALSFASAAAGLVVGLSSGLTPARFPGAAEFEAAFRGIVGRERLLLFPLGVATSIVTLLALLEHANFRSWRTRFQAAALVLVFGSGFLATGPLASAAEAVLAAAPEVFAEGLSPLLDHWQLVRGLAFGLTVTAFASLVAAYWMPLVVVPREAGVALAPRHRTLLLLLGTATLFEGYDRFIASLALPYIGEDLGAAESTLGYALSAIRIGALASTALGRFADRRGRRNLLLITILAYTVATAATGFSRGIVEFVLFQLLATIFLSAELSLAQVVIAEEFPPGFRAKGQAYLGAFGALGAGIAAMLFPIFQETAYGWRGLYFIGIAPLLLVGYFRRALPETARFERARSEGRTERYGFRDLLAPRLRLRFLVLLSLSIAITMAASPAFAFASYRATRDFGWSPAGVSAMILIGGGLGLGGWAVFGMLAERLGRRAVGLLAFAGGGLAVLAYYQSPWLAAAFGTLVFVEAGANVALNSLGTELFPTPMRSTAKSWITSAGFVGGVLGLAIVGLLADPLGGIERVITLLASLPMIVSPAIFLLPETRASDLEELA